MSTLATNFGQLEIEDGVQLYHRDFSIEFFGFPQLLNHVVCAYSSLPLTLNIPNVSDHQTSSLDLTLETRLAPISEYSDLILSVLPSRESTDALVEKYFTFIPCNRFLVEKERFYIEYEEFWSASAIDPFFLALLFAMISTPIGISGEENGTLDQRQKDYKNRLSEASTECLERGKYMERYCLRVLQAMLVNIDNFWMHKKSRDFPTHFWLTQ
ncbi:hypothetical protein NEOLI_001930, partial [Neolecta irregularis DAH-3]